LLALELFFIRFALLGVVAIVVGVEEIGIEVDGLFFVRWGAN
jgi:hypothetical protein